MGMGAELTALAPGKVPPRQTERLLVVVPGSFVTIAAEMHKTLAPRAGTSISLRTKQSTLCHCLLAAWCSQLVLEGGGVLVLGWLPGHSMLPLDTLQWENSISSLKQEGETELGTAALQTFPGCQTFARHWLPGIKKTIPLAMTPAMTPSHDWLFSFLPLKGYCSLDSYTLNLGGYFENHTVLCGQIGQESRRLG